MNRWLAILTIVFSPFSYANDVGSRIRALEGKILELVNTSCEDLAEKGQGQAAVACEDWRERELSEKRLELAELKSPKTRAAQPGGSATREEISGDAVR